jgi:hypothetical protein
MTPKQSKYEGQMAMTMTHSRAGLASPSRNIATFLCCYSFPPMYETYSFFVYFFFFLYQHHHPIFSSTTTTTGTTISTSFALLLRWKHVEFYLHAHIAWYLNMHWMLRILQAENGLKRNHSLSTGNDGCKGLFIALLNAL